MRNGVRAGVTAAVAVAAVLGLAGRVRAEPPVGVNGASLNRLNAPGFAYRYPQANFFGKLIDGKKGNGYAEGAFATARAGNLMLTAGGSLEQFPKGSDAKNAAADGKQGVFLYAGTERKVGGFGSVVLIAGANSTWATPVSAVNSTALIPEASLVVDATALAPVVTAAGITPKSSYAMANFGVSDVGPGRLVLSARGEFLSNSTNWSGGTDYVWKYGGRPGDDVMFFASGGTNTRDGGLIANGGFRARRVFSGEKDAKPHYIDAHVTRDTATGATTYSLMFSAPL